MALETETLLTEIESSVYIKLCYCCSIHGCIKDIFTEYYDTGDCEVYSEMIRSTFNINIAQDRQTNFPNTLNKLYICDHCIVQLRNAYTFKNTLMKNHEDFLRKLTKWQKAGVKNEEHRIKSECNYSDDGTLDFNDGPQTEIEDQSKINIKKESLVDNMIQSINHQFVIDNKMEPKERKSKKIAKMSTANSENKLNQPRKTSPETIVNIRKNKNTDSVKKRTKNSGAIGTILRDNSLKLISNSTLCAFQWKQDGEFNCYLCKEPYSDIKLLKNHTKTHTLKEIEEKITISNNGRVKVEITDLSCKICDTSLENLTDLQKHLKIHNITVKEHLLVPFRLNNEMKCQICCKNFKNFRLLKSHMLKHYQSFVCEKCGAEFYKKEYLTGHIKNKHEKKTNDSKKFKCRICHFKFSTYPRKLEHMIQNHGYEKPEFSCKLCSKVYIIKGLLNRHMKLSHLNEIKEKNFECDVCFKRFFRSHDVKRHKETHSEGLNYSCTVCNHSFKLKTSLDRHMRRLHK